MNTTPGAPTTSYRTAYILCLLLGWLGAHRYYLRRWGSAILYTLTLGLFGVGILLDLLILPLMVRERRDIEAGVELPSVRAEWADADSKSRFSRFQLPIRCALLLFVPWCATLASLGLGQPILLVLLVLIFAFALIVGSVGQGVYAMEDMSGLTQRVPFLPTILSTGARFQRHYLKHRPGSVLYYLLYPVLVIPSLLVSRAARSEIAAYFPFMILTFLGILAETAFSYSDVFPPYISVVDSLRVCLILGCIGMLIMCMCVMPIVSTTYYLSVTRRIFRLRILSALALVICLLTVYAWQFRPFVTLRGWVTLTEKAGSTEFMEDLNEFSEMFLQNKIASATQDGARVAVDAALTNRYRTMVAGIVRDEEMAAFTVITVRQDTDRQPWLAIRYVPGAMDGRRDIVILYVIGPDRLVRRHWSELPPWFQDRFVMREDFWSRSKAQAEQIATQLATSSPDQLAATLVEKASSDVLNDLMSKVDASIEELAEELARKAETDPLTSALIRETTPQDLAKALIEKAKHEDLGAHLGNSRPNEITARVLVQDLAVPLSILDPLRAR